MTSLVALKKICKIKKINKIYNYEGEKAVVTNISKINKDNKELLIREIKKCNAAIIIQRAFRNKYSVDQVCPICFESTKYAPCFAFRPKGQQLFIHYNLSCLAEFLTSTGDFRDPKTREVYTDTTLKKIDVELKQNGIKLAKFKSVYSASKNKKYYKRIKEKEENILILERCLDDIITSMKSLIEHREYRRGSVRFTLHSILFTTFTSYFNRLFHENNNVAISLLDRTITGIQNVLKEPVDEESNNIRDTVLHFLYQVKYGEYGS
jgi:hypothetical protein